MTDMVSGNVTPEMLARMEELAAAQTAELHRDLVPYVEYSPDWGKMLRHPLVYAVPLIPGFANNVYEAKGKALREAEAEEDWAACVWLHERPYRLTALIDYIIGRDEDDDIITLDPDLTSQDTLDLVADVWVDSENIGQNIEEWRAIFGYAYGLWLGNTTERRLFDLLPDPIPAWRGGTVGDWSWTTSEETALFFSRRSGIEPRHALIPKADCFGYLTRRSEYELLVRLTTERRPLVYPNEFLETEK